MTDRSKFDAEDFLIDSTFQLYCAGTDQTCTAYWEKYIQAHPEQQAIIFEAKKLYRILSGNKRQLDVQITNYKQNFKGSKKTIKFNQTWLKIAAAILVIAGASLFFLYNPKKVVTNEITVFNFSTKAGERKKIKLPDGSTVFLNAKSSLVLKKDFNVNTREVTLNGEAYFDVEHNKNKPFKVHTADFNINVLGTAFNVKAYGDGVSSEATLIRGLITMETTSGDGGIITLKPSQKVTFYRAATLQTPQKTTKAFKTKPEISINHYTVIKDSTIVETAWTQNRIEIYDQDFEEIRQVLEKWYNVEIKFDNPKLANYRFTATFGNESIKQVLEALQKVENFKYEIKNNKVIISK